MIEISLIALKFAALIVGGVFAAIGLLTDYRNENGTVSKWGKIALFGIILSTVIGAGTQAVESYRDRDAALKNDAANRRSEEQTRALLGQITRAVYPLGNVAIRHFMISYPTNNSLIAKSLTHIAPWPKDDDWEPALRLMRGDVNYPKGIDFFVEPLITVSLWKKGANSAKDDPDLRFEITLRETYVTIFNDRLRVAAADYEPIPAENLELSPSMASLEDVRDAEIHLQIVTYPDSEKGATLRDEMLRETEIVTFVVSIGNHDIPIEMQPNAQLRDRFEFTGKVTTPQ